MKVDGVSDRARAALPGVMLGALALGLCLYRADRSYGYDEGVTVGYFVRQDSIVSALTEQRVFNNHPLLSGLNWLIWNLGGQTEFWQRLAPAVATAAVVLIVHSWVIKRAGQLMAVAAGAVVALNPLVISVGRQARGYSLAALLVVAATVMVASSAYREKPLAQYGYASFVALAMLGHLYAAVPLVAHGAALLAKDRSLVRTWLRTAGAGAVVAALPYAAMADTIAQSRRQRQGTFDPSFPFDALAALGGGIVPGALLLAVAFFSLTTAPRLAAAAAATGLVGFVWAVLQPFDLYARFLVWVVPLVALASAVYEQRQAIVATVLVIACALGLPDLLDALDDDADIRDVAEAIEADEAAGRVPCTLGAFGESLRGYTEDVPFRAPTDLDDCDVVYYWPSDAHFLPAALDARHPAVTDGRTCRASRASTEPQETSGC